MKYSISLNFNYMFISEYELGKVNFPLGKMRNPVYTTEYLALGKALLARYILIKVKAYANLLNVHN